MQTVPRVRVVQGPAVLTDEWGRKWTTETTHVTVDRWRKTAFGKINLGWTWMSTPRFVEIK